MLGICTRYTAHDATFGALRIADMATSCGIDVTLLTPTNQPSALGSRWDQSVVRSSDMLFTEWVKTVDHVIWTTIPHLPQVDWVANLGKKASVLLIWQELSPYDQATLAAMTHIICPNTASYDLMQKYGFRNCINVPWDAGLPVHQKPRGYQPSTIKVLLPLWDGNANRTEMTILNVVTRALCRHKNVSFTVVYNSSTLASCGKRKISELQRGFPGRFQGLKRVKPRDRLLLYQSHDLTLWPTHHESTCLTGLQSIELGTPVVGFSFRPTCELLTSHNSVTVSCHESVSDMGVPRAIPNYELLDELLRCALQDVEFVRQLQTTVLLGVEGRRTTFSKQLRRILL